MSQRITPSPKAATKQCSQTAGKDPIPSYKNAWDISHAKLTTTLTKNSAIKNLTFSLSLIGVYGEVFDGALCAYPLKVMIHKNLMQIKRGCVMDHKLETKHLFANVRPAEMNLRLKQLNASRTAVASRSLWSMSVPKNVCVPGDYHRLQRQALLASAYRHECRERAV